MNFDRPEYVWIMEEIRLKKSGMLVWPEHQEGVKLDYDGSKVSYKCD